MKNLITLTALLSLLPLCASAGTYFRASAIWQDMDDIEVTTGSKFASSVDESFGISAAVGYEFGAISAELEGLSISNAIVTDPNAPAAVQGDVDQYRIFANAYFTIPGIPVVDPYIGGGFGLAHFSMDGFDIQEGNTTYAGSADTNMLGFQFMAGLKVNLPVTGLYVYGGYRFVRWDGFDEEVSRVDDPSTPADESAGADGHLAFDSGHMFEIGAGYRF